MPRSTAREILVRPAYATIAAEAPCVRAALGLSRAAQHGTRNPSAARLRHHCRRGPICSGRSGTFACRAGRHATSHCGPNICGWRPTPPQLPHGPSNFHIWLTGSLVRGCCDSSGRPHPPTYKHIHMYMHVSCTQHARIICGPHYLWPAHHSRASSSSRPLIINAWAFGGANYSKPYQCELLVRCAARRAPTSQCCTA